MPSAALVTLTPDAIVTVELPAASVVTCAVGVCTDSTTGVAGVAGVGGAVAGAPVVDVAAIEALIESAADGELPLVVAAVATVGADVVVPAAAVVVVAELPKTPASIGMRSRYAYAPPAMPSNTMAARASGSEERFGACADVVVRPSTD